MYFQRHSNKPFNLSLKHMDNKTKNKNIKRKLVTVKLAAQILKVQ